MPIRELSKELQEVAIREINEDPKRIQSDLDYIREWLTKQPHINARTDDQFLLSFLRGTKFSLERTKEKLDMYYTLKTVTPELYKNRDPFAPEIQKVLETGVTFPLPKITHAGCPRYVFSRNSALEKNNLDPAAVVKVSAMIQDILLIEDDDLAVSGFAMVQDMADISLAYFKSMPFGLMKKATMCFQQGYPYRIKGMNVFNIPTFFDVIYSIVKPILNEKFKKRMRVYSTLEELYETIPKEIMPEEYGGQGGKIEDIVAYWKAKVESYSDWFKEDESYGTDEKKRPGRPKTSESIFGLEGSFRQLSVD